MQTMQTMQDKTIRELAKECKTVEDVHQMLRDLFKDTLQGIFEAEIEEHLGYKKHSTDGINSGNSRIEDRIASLRREINLTQEQLANYLDVSRQLVASWESGRTKPNLNHIIELTKIFDCSTDYLFGLKKTRKPESYLPESDEYIVEFLLTIRYICREQQQWL